MVLHTLEEPTVRGLFQMAGYSIIKVERSVNPYWRSNETAGPMWTVVTNYGTFTLHWRKRVLELDWAESKLRMVVTEEDVTKTSSCVHIWPGGHFEKCAEYLRRLKETATVLHLKLEVKIGECPEGHNMPAERVKEAIHNAINHFHNAIIYPGFKLNVIDFTSKQTIATLTIIPETKPEPENPL